MIITARLLPVSAALAASLALSACATPPPPLTLVQTKATVQLLRNETATRIPAKMIAVVENTSDLSQECDAGDPIRHWESSALVAITAEGAPHTRNIFRDLVNNYVGDGWKEGNVGDRQAVLTNDNSMAKVDILMVDDADGDGEGASLRVVVTGPCVATAGADSEEVVRLETQE